MRPGDALARRLLAVAPALPVAAAFAAHAAAVAAARGGERYVGGPLLDRDVLHAQRFAVETGAALRAAWDAGIVSFVTGGAWAAPVRTGALNMLDFALVWPLRAWLEPATALSALNVTLLALAAAGGVAFARAIGAGPAGQAVAGAVASGSGMVFHHVVVGQYPQALVGPALIALAGLARAWRGEAHGTLLAAGGATIAGLLYWQYAVPLGVAAVVFAAGSLVAGDRPAPGFVRRAAVAGGLVAIALAPAAWAVVDAMPELRTLAGPAWGTPLPDVAAGADPSRHELAAVGLDRVLRLDGAWLPLGAVGLAALALRRRELAWWTLLAVGLVLVLGPRPEVAGEPVTNPVYEAVYRWVPTASRMKHPIRYGLLVVAGLAALSARGADRVAARDPRVGALAVALAVAWPWATKTHPLPSSPFPGAVAARLAACEEIWLPEDTDRKARCRWMPLDGLTFVARLPADRCTSRGVRGPSPEALARDEAVRPLLARVLAGEGDALAPGACVVLLDGDPRTAATRRALGRPDRVPLPPRTLLPDGVPHTLLVFPGSAPTAGVADGS